MSCAALAHLLQLYTGRGTLCAHACKPPSLFTSLPSHPLQPSASQCILFFSRLVLRFALGKSRNAPPLHNAPQQQQQQGSPRRGSRTRYVYRGRQITHFTRQTQQQQQQHWRQPQQRPALTRVESVKQQVKVTQLWLTKAPKNLIYL